MNLLNYRFSFNANIRVNLFENNRLSISTIWQRSFIKFNEFFANRFFVFQEWKYFWKNKIKGFTRKIPIKLISFFNVLFISFNKINISTKSFYNPWKDWIFAVIAAKQDFIIREFVGFASRVYDSKATFSINKSSKISEIFFSWNDCIFNGFKKILVISIDKIFAMFNPFEPVGQIGFRSRSIKINKDLGFFLFFYKIGQNFFNKVKGFYSFEIKNKFYFVMKSIFSWLSNYKITISKICKKFNDIFINGSQFYSNRRIASKTCIPVKISCNVSQFIKSVHEKYITRNAIFKSISNRSDDPCELRQTCGSRFAYATRITNDSWVINLRATLA